MAELNSTPYSRFEAGGILYIGSIGTDQKVLGIIAGTLRISWPRFAEHVHLASGAFNTIYSGDQGVGELDFDIKISGANTFETANVLAMLNQTVSTGEVSRTTIIVAIPNTGAGGTSGAGKKLTVTQCCARDNVELQAAGPGAERDTLRFRLSVYGTITPAAFTFS